MHSFTEYISEAAAQKLQHLTHLEDVIIGDPRGVSYAYAVLADFAKTLNGGTVSRALNVSIKWDGAPSLVFGTDPADGRPFVATKSAFAKTPKLAKTHADIDEMYTTGVNGVLHVAFDTLAPHARIPLQGDVLFLSSTRSQQVIDGVASFVFQPNTILYAVPVDSHLGHRIARASIGIVVHTMYVGGATIPAMRATPITPSTFSDLAQRARSALVLDASHDDVSGSVTFTAQEASDYALALASVRSYANVPVAVYEMMTDGLIQTLLNEFLNTLVRANKTLTPERRFDELLLFVQQRKAREMLGRKTAKGQAAQNALYQAVEDTLLRHSIGLIRWFHLHDAITRAKLIVVQKLAQASRVGTFIVTPTGLQVTGPEGFVAVSRSGRMVKLVDRLEFSRHNFQATKNWS